MELLESSYCDHVKPVAMIHVAARAGVVAAVRPRVTRDTAGRAI